MFMRCQPLAVSKHHWACFCMCAHACASAVLSVGWRKCHKCWEKLWQHKRAWKMRLRNTHMNSLSAYVYVDLHVCRCFHVSFYFVATLHILTKFGVKNVATTLNLWANVLSATIRNRKWAEFCYFAILGDPTKVKCRNEGALFAVTIGKLHLCGGELES